MTYQNTQPGRFLSRPNRFVAHVSLGGQTVIAHVKNTGRCKELLIPGADVVLAPSNNPNRKTAYDLIAVWKGDRLVNMDSQAPNRVFGEYLRSGCFVDGITGIKPEAMYQNSRFDFYVERIGTTANLTQNPTESLQGSRVTRAEAGGSKLFIEVKGVTLEQDGIALFPDAPTQRGVKHLHELARCVSEGYEAHVVFVVQMSGVRHFAPNHQTHPAFGEALIGAAKAGVRVTALACQVTENSLNISTPVPVRLS